MKTYTSLVVLLALLAAAAMAHAAAGITQGLDIGVGDFTTRAAAPGEIAVTGPMLITSPGYYILTADVSAAGSAIGIKSNGVTLDLNGHTITYGTGNVYGSGITTYNGLQNGNVGHFGVISTDDPRDTDDYAFDWNSRFTNVVVKNGRIVQGGGTGLAYSNGVSLEGTSGAIVENVRVEVSCPDSMNVIGGPSSKIRLSTFVSTNTVVSNRHQQLSQVISGTGGEVYQCVVTGGPQEGVKAYSSAVVRDNLIRTNTTATNGYGVIGYGQANVQAYRNDIVAFNGRGIHLSENSSGWAVYDNYVEVREKGNTEYPTLQTHGIKFERTQNSQVYDNTVVSISTTVGALHGQPTALNMDIDANASNVIRDCSFVARNLAAEPAYGMYLLAFDGTGSEIKDLAFFTNVYGFGIPWDGANNATIRACDFRKLSPSDSVTFAKFSNGTGQPSQNNRFIDCAYYGIDPKSYSFYAPGREADYSVGWSLSVLARDGGAALPGADVTITRSGTPVASGTTDAQGRFAADLMEFKVAHVTGVAGGTVTNYGAYTITVTGSGHTRQFTAQAKSPMEGVVDVDESGLLVLAPTTLKPAMADLDYTCRLAATGTTATTWSLVSGSLPAGLDLVGNLVTGTPDETGTFAFRLQAAAAGETAWKDVSLTVNPFRAAWRTAGDANSDGAIDDNDLSLLLANWNTRRAWSSGDFNYDVHIDDSDLSLLLAGWTGSAAAVPEPGVLAMLALLLPGLLRRRPA